MGSMPISRPAKIAIGGGLALGGAYAIYRYWYLPGKIRSELQRQAMILAQQRGISQADALAQLGGAACVGIGAYYGVPPQASQGICQKAGGMAADLARQLPQIVAGTMGAVGYGLDVVGTGAGSFL